MILPSDFQSTFTVFEAGPRGLLYRASLMLLIGIVGFFYLQFTRRNLDRIRLPSIVLFGIGLIFAGASLAYPAW
jgi:hypothetical protein